MLGSSIHLSNLQVVPLEYGYRDHALFYAKVLTSDPDGNTLAK